MRIGIITSGSLPVPASEGGAVETLTNYYIEMNEINKVHDITLFSIYDYKSSLLSKKYKKTNFIFIKATYRRDKLRLRLSRYIYSINRRIFKIQGMRYISSYNKAVIRYIKKNNNFDVLIVESNLNIILPLSKHINGKILYHSHYNDINMKNNSFDIEYHKRILSKCKGVICVSNFIKEEIKKVNCDTSLKVIHNCIDLGNYCKNRNNDRLKELKVIYGINDSDIIFMYSGRLVKEKGIKELLLAFKQINIEHAKLFIVGARFYSQNEKDDFIKELEILSRDIQNQVVFTGYIDYSEMALMWALCDIAVVPTLYVEEAAGLVVIEAMAAGKPVIFTDSGGMLDYVDNDCGVMIKRDSEFIKNLGVAMESLAVDKEARLIKGTKGILKSKQFNTENYYKEINDYIEEILG